MKQRKVKGWGREEEEKTRKKAALSHSGNDKSGKYDDAHAANEIVTKRGTMPIDDLNTSGSQKLDAIVELQQSHGNRFVQRIVSDGSEATTVDNKLVQSIEAHRGSGQPLEDGVRSRMEATLRRDFDDVRIHTDSEADALSQDLYAKAFTVGKDIFFRQGAYEPDSVEGTGIIAHELTHVIQQSNSTSASPKRITDISEAAETQAERVEQAISLGKNIVIEPEAQLMGVIARSNEETTAPAETENTEAGRIAREDNLANDFYEKIVRRIFNTSRALESNRIADAIRELDFVHNYLDAFAHITELGDEVWDIVEDFIISLNKLRSDLSEVERGEQPTTPATGPSRALTANALYTAARTAFEQLDQRYFSRHGSHSANYDRR